MQVMYILSPSAQVETAAQQALQALVPAMPQQEALPRYPALPAPGWQQEAAQVGNPAVQPQPSMPVGPVAQLRQAQE